MVWALDPDDGGRVVWSKRVGAGGVLGGVQWGTATDGKAVYAAVSDIAFISLVLGQPLVPIRTKEAGCTHCGVDTGARRSGARRRPRPARIAQTAVRRNPAP